MTKERTVKDWAVEEGTVKDRRSEEGALWGGSNAEEGATLRKEQFEEGRSNSKKEEAIRRRKEQSEVGRTLGRNNGGRSGSEDGPVHNPIDKRGWTAQECVSLMGEVSA